MFKVFEWIRSHITFSGGIPMDKKYYDGLIEKGLALEAPRVNKYIIPKENRPSWVHTTEMRSDVDMHGNPYYYEVSISYPEEQEWADFDD